MKTTCQFTVFDLDFKKPNVATNRPIVNSMISSSTPIPTQDRRYVQPALSYQRTASDGRSSGPITPTIQRIQERQYMPHEQQQVLTEQQLPYVKQPSMPTTPQDRRYMQQKYEQSEEEEDEANGEANSSVFFTDNSMAAQMVERGLPNQFDTQMQFQSDSTKLNERRGQSQFEESTVYKQPSVPTTPQGRRFMQQHDDDKRQEKPPSVPTPTTPQAYRNNQIIDEPVAIKPPAVPSVVAQTQDRNRNPIQVDNKAQDRRYVQQQSPGQYRPTPIVQSSERRNIEVIFVVWVLDMQISVHLIVKSLLRIERIRAAMMRARVP